MSPWHPSASHSPRGLRRRIGIGDAERDKAMRARDVGKPLFQR
jgi:hypothetical protein